MADTPRTTPTDADVDDFIEGVASAQRRADARTLVELMRSVTGEEPRMWGPSIIGFGNYHYRYPSGREGDMCAAGFSPRSSSTTIYFADGFDGYADHLARLGPHTTSVACLYVKRVDAIDLDVLAEMIRSSYATLTSGTFGTRLS